MKAYFGRPVDGYLEGGAHVGMEVVTMKGRNFVMILYPEGLFGGPKNSLYFPHGEFHFGEDVQQCAARLVKECLGMALTNYRVVDVWSWVAEEKNHWHIVVVAVARVAGEPMPRRAIEYSFFDWRNVPANIAWWTKEDLRRLAGEG